jgi:hypothetical protein
MEFFNATKFEDFIDKDVHVILTSNSNVCDTLPLCHAFLRDGKLHLDLIPQLNKKYVVAVPDDSIFSRNDQELSMGRYAVVIRTESGSGAIIRDLLEQKKRHEAGQK